MKLNYSGRILIVLVVFGFVFSGLLNPVFYIAGRNPYEFVLVFLFISLTGISLNKNNIRLRINKIDYYFFMYYCSIICLPFLLNIYELIHYKNDFYVIIISLKLYIIYRIFFEIDYIFKVKKIEQYAFNVIIFCSILAGLIGFIRLANIGGLESLVDYIWPAEKFPYRLTSTMSGINGGAAYFSIISFIAFHLYSQTKNKYFLIATIFLLLFVVLSGSLTSILLIILFYSYQFFVKLSFKGIFYSILLVSTTVLLLINLLPIREAIDVLYEERINKRVINRSGQTMMPATLEYRYRRWDGLIDRGLEKPVFGHGASTTYNQLPSYVLTHNYYIFLFLYTGIIGVSTFLILYLVMLNKVKENRNKKYMFHILLFIFIAQGTQLTLNYGGIAEMFGLLIFLNRDQII